MRGGFQRASAGRGDREPFAHGHGHAAEVDPVVAIVLADERARDAGGDARRARDAHPADHRSGTGEDFTDHGNHYVRREHEVIGQRVWQLGLENDVLLDAIAPLDVLDRRADRAAERIGVENPATRLPSRFKTNCAAALVTTEMKTLLLVTVYPRTRCRTAAWSIAVRREGSRRERVRGQRRPDLRLGGR